MRLRIVGIERERLPILGFRRRIVARVHLGRVRERDVRADLRPTASHP